MSNEAFFDCCKQRDITNAKRIYEENHIDIMFNENCVVKYAIRHKHMDVIKWLCAIDDFSIFSENDDTISIMTLACRYNYFDLIKYLVAAYYTVDFMDICEILTNQKSKAFVQKIHTYFVKPQDLINDCLHHAESQSVIKWMVSYGYVVSEYILEHTHNIELIRYALSMNLIDVNLSRKIATNACITDNIHILKLINVSPDMEIVYHSLHHDPRKCLEYIEDTPFKCLMILPQLRNILDKAMVQGSIRSVKYIHEMTGETPSIYASLHDTYEYTSYVLTHFEDVNVQPVDLICSSTKLFNLILKNITITSENIDACISSTISNECEKNIYTFLNHLDSLPIGVVTNRHFADIFIVCCLNGFMQIAKTMWNRHGYILSYASLVCENFHQYIPNGWRYCDILNGVIDTSTKLFKILLAEDKNLEMLRWVVSIYKIEISYKHVKSALKIEKSENHRILVYLLKQITLTESQLKHVFTEILLDTGNVYFICKYLYETYSHWMTPAFKSILFKNALYYTTNAFRLFEDCEYSVSTCLTYAVYGHNEHAFKYLVSKHGDYSLRSRGDSLFRYACSVECLEIVKYMCTIIDVYDYIKDDDTDTITPIIKNSIEYYIQQMDYNSIIKKMKKSNTVLEECSICYERGNTKTLCNHTYCIVCLLKWYLVSHECPMCKQGFDIKHCTYTKL